MDPAALIVVDVQRGFDDPVWGPRNNPASEENIAALLEAWRERGQPIVYVRHDSDEDGSPFTPGEPGNDFHDFLTGDPDLLVVKSVNSAFHGEPDLAEFLDGLDRAVVVSVLGEKERHEEAGIDEDHRR